MASDDATLSALTLSGVTLSPSFASGTVAYTARVAHGVSSTTVVATPTHAGASREITPADTDANAAGHQVTLTAGGETVITAEVTAQDKMTTKTYTVTVTRAAAEPPQSDDATLSALSLSGVSLSPAFASRTITYTASVANSVESTTVTASTSHASATVVIAPADADANGHQVNLGVGDTEITAEVTAEDGSAMKTYTVTVTRAPAGASSVATLSELTLSGVTLSPVFASRTITYTANVDNSVSATTVTALTTHDKATRKILIGGVQDLDADVDLAVGDNTITVEVTAEDGVTTKTYTVTVTRAAPPAAAGVPSIVIAASKEVFDRPGGYRERDLIIALYNLESDATWSGDNYYGDPSTLDYVHRTDILDAGGSTALADLERRNECEGPAYSERNHIQMSVDRQIRKVNENPETRGGGVIDAGDCVNAFKVTVTVWTGADYIPEGSEGRYGAPYAAQLTCQFDGLDSTHDDFRALPWGGEHEGPGWYYHEYVLCTDANGDLAPDSMPTIPALNWEPPE